MKIFKRIGIVLGTSFALFACTHGPRKGQNIDYPQELERVFLLVSQGEGDLTLKQIQSYLDRSESLQWHGHAYYLKGRVYQQQKNWDKAVESFRKAVRQSSDFDSLVEAQSLYRLSQVYEQTGQTKELIASLLDLMKRRTLLDQLIGDVEIPARLAAAYASYGQIAKAETLHVQASQSFLKILRTYRNHLSLNDIAKNYYHLGLAIYPVANEDFASLLAKLNLGQKYLLAAAEVETSMWSEKSKQVLIQSYQKLWDLLQQHPGLSDLSYDPDAQKKQIQTEQLILASDFYDLALRLQDERKPTITSQSLAGEVLRNAWDWKLRLETFASKLSLGPEITRSHKMRDRPLLNKIDLQAPAVFKEGVQAPTNPPETKLPPKMSPGPPNSIGEDPNL